MTWNQFRTKWATEGRRCALRTLYVNDGKEKSYSAFVLVTSPDEAVYNFEAKSDESLDLTLNELFTATDAILTTIFPPAD